MPDPIYRPTNEEFMDALVSFVLVSSSVAYLRGREFGPERFAHVARELADEFAASLSLDDVQAAVVEFDNRSRGALGALFEELVYVSHKYQKSARDAEIKLDIPGPVRYFNGETGNVFSNEAIDDIETVKGSLEKLLSKLPKWAQRIIEALMEVLKLTRGTM